MTGISEGEKRQKQEEGISEQIKAKNYSKGDTLIYVFKKFSYFQSG